MSDWDLVTSSSNLQERNISNTDCNMVKELRTNARAQESPPNLLSDNQQEAQLGNPSFFNDLKKVNLMANNVTDSRSLLDFEELLDKEIEEAQEHRRKCEVEEKSALMAYRKAQRVLIEAHARCSQLYSKRELYSAQLRSFMMENPNLFFSQIYHDHVEAGFKSLSNVSDDNVPPIPPTRHQVLSADINNKFGYEANVSPENNEVQKVLNLHVSEQNLVSDPHHEPDGSPSKVCKQPLADDGACSSFGDLSHSSTEDGEIIESNHKSAHEHLVSEGVSEIDAAREKDIYEESEREGQDCLLLEASLRAQLFEKLKAKRFSKKGSSADQFVEKEDENYNVGEMMETDADMRQPCEPENDEKQLAEELDDSREERFAELPNQMIFPLDSSNTEHDSSTEVPLHGHISLDVEESTSGTFFFPAVKNTFNHLKIIERHDVPQSAWTSPGVLISTSDEKIEDGGFHNRNKLGVWSFDIMDFSVGQSGSFSPDAVIDPVWALCMYELRGKCNNDECSWQHLRDYCASSKLEASDNSDTQFRKQSGKENLSSTARPKKSLDDPLLAPPTYFVGLDILRLDSHLGTSASPQGYGQCWQKNFSAFLVLSSLCPTVLQSNEPFLHGTESRIEVQSSWDRQLSYFQNKIGTPRKHDTSGVEQSLEMALHNLKDEADKHKSMVEAVVLLARAIEDDPTSTVLWIPYLLIFYSNQKSKMKDDLFQYAVKYNEESYELWLLYINSRVHLEDRLAAFESALSALCYHASKSDDILHASQCILDIFLQMIDCLCMSGNVGKAIAQISELFSSTKKTEDHSQPSLLNIVTCLTICDKFVFWISCVYLLVYKKLPDLVVHRFECWKESSAIDWPSACLRYDEKQQATSLLETAVDSLEPYVNHESLGDEKNLRAAHLFAVNHVKCISVLEGLECGRNLLGKYIKSYPSCLELVLMSARAEYELANSSFHGFEEALRTWPDKGGVQGIWNQYAAFALQKGKLDFVKELMDRWSGSVLEAQNSEKVVLSTNEPSLQSASAADLHAWFSTFGPVDTVFGMLNFSLYKLLKNDHTEAHVASELAFKAATVDNYQLCLKEFVPFWLRDCIQHEGGVYLKSITKILHVHLVDNRALLLSEPLSLAFVKKLKKPRVQQLVSKLFAPVSADFSLTFMILEVWDGLSMLPNVLGKTKDFVDFVEAMMEILPSNYQLAVMVCKELCKTAKSTNISAGLHFWAGSLLVNAFYHAVPVAPEFAWVEAAEVLHALTDSRSIKESFLKKALTVYPFSVKLWKSCLHLSENEGDRELVKEAAKEKGVEF
ncbi:OLC1v1027678C1 [Oldenlandia corymbosa var. corymbosa]|nr:OLC1v1027678C1 [Oldenlandia corymbosa var. corymbosa]